MKKRTARRLKSYGKGIGIVAVGAAIAAVGYWLWKDLGAEPMEDMDEPGPVTPSTTKATAADAALGVPGHNEEERLDEALLESFPASDPVSISIDGEKAELGSQETNGRTR